MSPKDPFKDSPYDSAGMPMATTTANYDDVETRRLSSVRQRIDPFAEAREVVPLDHPENLIDNDYEQKKISSKLTHSKLDPKNFNSAIDVPIELPVAPVDYENLDDDSFLDEDLKVKGLTKDDVVIEEEPKTEDKTEDKK